MQIKFPSGSGFTASYWFSIEDQIPHNLAIVIERPDLYSITCNGMEVNAPKNAWWLDKAFGKIDITSAVHKGENLVVIKASPFTMYHELEPAYLLGDFTLKAADKGFVIGPDQPLKPGRWNEQGHPFYSAGVVYSQDFQIEKASGNYQVVLTNWYGSIAKVRVNGLPSGYIAAPPWTCDVTKQIQPGSNSIEVLVIGTLKNTLGPHHNKPGLGSAWPAMFQKGPNPGPPPGKDYDTVGYGLFQPFVLQQVVEAGKAAKPAQ